MQTGNLVQTLLFVAFLSFIVVESSLAPRIIDCFVFLMHVSFVLTFNCYLWQDASNPIRQLASGGMGETENGISAPQLKAYSHHGERVRAMSASGKVRHSERNVSMNDYVLIITVLWCQKGICGYRHTELYTEIFLFTKFDKSHVDLFLPRLLHSDLHVPTSDW